MNASVHILGVRIDDVTYAEFLDTVSRLVRQQSMSQIVTVNTEYLLAAYRDPGFADVLRLSALNVPDGIGVVWAARWLGRPLRERVTGSDGIYRLAELCAQHGFRLYLLGAAPGIAQQAAAILSRRYPRLVVCGTFSGSPSASEEAEICRRIHEARADVLLVAYGGSVQEAWIAHNQAQTGAAVAMGVGGAFDFVAGVQKRAPRWMQRAGLEWLYRLIRQPWRWRRMLALPQTAVLVFWQRFRRQGDTHG
jgi:N-acetylglucosaminyldiphosphoundecaprenol N-acetyl-beta-D-mannosaminyltransferase